ncbi:MAG: hypothetical protein NT038_04625 [Euryarchaeota archaeon]|nr:hypothetical protein [Euryarchaeota archaeon]
MREKYTIIKRQCIVPVVLGPFVVIILVLSSGCVSLTNAYVSDKVLTDGWYEDIANRDGGTQFLGFERWVSSRYATNDTEYPAFLVVMTMKTLVVLNDEELEAKIRDIFNVTIPQTILINDSTKQTGGRYILRAHQTMYTVYDGVDIQGNISKNVKIIGEAWNCQTSGTSIFCIGVACVTNMVENNSVEQTKNWEKIVMDDIGSVEIYTGATGLIANVICHYV